MSETPSNDRTLLVEVLPDTIRCTVRAGDRLTRIRATLAALDLEKSTLVFDENRLDKLDY